MVMLRHSIPRGDLASFQVLDVIHVKGRDKAMGHLPILSGFQPIRVPNSGANLKHIAAVTFQVSGQAWASSSNKLNSHGLLEVVFKCMWWAYSADCTNYVGGAYLPCTRGYLFVLNALINAQRLQSCKESNNQAVPQDEASPCAVIKQSSSKNPHVTVTCMSALGGTC